MPCWDENGLLPGRGAPGFGAGLLPGFGAAPGSGAPGVAFAAGAAGAAGWDGAGVAAAGLAAGFAAELAAGVAAGLEAGFGALGVAGFAAAGLAAAALLEPGKASRSLRATGGSTVEDAERTNSPMSCNLVSASFEVIPSSLASS